MNILPITESSLEEVVAFVTRINPEREHNISYFGETAAEIRAEMTVIYPPQGLGFIAFSDEGKIIGLLGAELDVGLGRCWWYGPLVEHQDWHAIADRLYAANLALLPKQICDQELYGGSGNVRLGAFAHRHDFALHSEGVVLTLEELVDDHVPELFVSAFDGKYTRQFNQLHARLFPNTYYSAHQLVELAQDTRKQLFIHVRDGKLAGYIFLQVRDASRDAYIDFIGVDESLRWQGIGRQLLAYASHWALSQPQVAKITLTVSTDNTPAIRLYQALGFKEGVVSQGYRKRT